MLTEISDYDIQPGLLVEFWARPRLPGEPPDDSRPPSYLQEAHVRSVDAMRRAGCWSPSWLAMAFDLPGKVGVEQLGSVLSAWIDHHEAVRSGFRFADKHLRRFTYASGDLVVRPRVVGRFSSGRAVGVHLEAVFDRATDPLAGRPPFLGAAVVRERSTTVFTAFDHSLTDGYSCSLVPHEVHELHSALLADRDPDLEPAGSHADYSAAERAEADGMEADHPGVQIWQRFLDRTGGVHPEFPLELGVPAGQAPESAGRLEDVMSAPGAEAFEAVCRQAGGRFHTGLLAACAIAAFEAGGSQDFCTTVPMHTRFEPQWVLSQGWYVNVLPVHIRVGATESFTEVFARATAAMHTALRAVRVPSIRACQLIGASPAPRFTVSYMDLRVVPGIEKWPRWNTRCLGKSDRGDHVFMWFHHGPEGVSVTTAHPETAVARNNVAAYVHRVRHVMNTVATTGGYEVRRPMARTRLSPPAPLHDLSARRQDPAGSDAARAVRNTRSSGDPYG
ncbi:condensation domain-containing protein [Streptomyces sp. NPDC005931]|uniref:condensation domain-containing protein n=1 Tax=Streptomyces sp. NPDC005931 TaxID=3364737 RepID=UPI00368783E9